MLKLGAGWPVGDGWSLWPQGFYCSSDCKQTLYSSRLLVNELLLWADVCVCVHTEFRVIMKSVRNTRYCQIITVPHLTYNAPTKGSEFKSPKLVRTEWWW